MIMPRGQALLSPASPSFIWITLLLALLLDFLPLGRVVWMPDFLAVVLVFWSIHQSRRVGLTVAFAFGLALDVHQAALLGQNALSFSVLIFLANMAQRRILWFPVLMQAVQLLPVFVAAQGITVALRLIVGGAPPGWHVLLAPLLEAALWPVVSALLLAPQRRASRSDANRSL
ncbi:MAG: rod shape-determining protein MreD [Burkholderiaceae bacterium]|jgi:rod shape-determining protein MreD|nr:rod shape-determining protein MreD [Burkholderiaceae bacterium]